MIGIRENDFGAEFFKRLLRQALHRRGGADGHERRRMNHAMRRGQAAKPRSGRVSLQNFKVKTHPANYSRSAMRSGERADPADFRENVKRPASRNHYDSLTDRNFLRAGRRSEEHT